MGPGIEEGKSAGRNHGRIKPTRPLDFSTGSEGEHLSDGRNGPWIKFQNSIQCFCLLTLPDPRTFISKIWFRRSPRGVVEMVTPINPMTELSPTFTQDEAGADELGRDRGMQITHFFTEL